jgi:hypothetical protein
MRPAELMTRCQGTRREVCRSTVPTRRARRGNPATSAMVPYVLTFPRGIFSTDCRMRSALSRGASIFVRRFFSVVVPFALRIAIDSYRGELFASRTPHLRIAHLLDRDPVMHRFLRSISAIRIAPALSAGKRDAEGSNEGQDSLQKIARGIWQQVKQHG